MKCEQIKKLLVAYLDGEVTPGERQQIEGHLASCPACREELKALSATRGELRQALNMQVEEISPSPELWQKVQARLENSPRPSFWQKYGGWLNRPVWRAAIPIALVVMIIGTLWGTGVLPGFGGMSSPPPVPAPTVAAPTEMPLPLPAPPPPFQTSVVPEEAQYLPGQPVEVKLSLTNVSSTPITLDQYPPEIRVTPRININFVPIVFSVPGGTQPRELSPNETISVDFIWDQKDNSGGQVPPGWYNIIFGEITASQEGRRYTFNPGTPVLIQYPQGTKEKIYDLDQSQTVNGITVTLERVELTADGAGFYFFFIPPGYTPPPSRSGLLPMPPTMPVMAKAEYTVNGITKYAGTAGFNTKGDGIGLTWGGGPGKLDPVPSDAQEITFTITQVNEWQGPWEFKIQLVQ